MAVQWWGDLLPAALVLRLRSPSTNRLLKKNPLADLQRTPEGSTPAHVVVKANYPSIFIVMADCAATEPVAVSNSMTAIRRLRVAAS